MSRISRFLTTALSITSCSFSVLVTVTSYPQSSVRCLTRYGPTKPPPPITNAVARIKLGLQDHVELGNLDAKRDWGHSKDYVRAMWLLLQQEEPDDYVIATNETRTVREFAKTAFAAAGIEVEFEGEGVNEIAKDKATGKVVLKVNPDFFRPAEVELLIGNPAKAEAKLGWKREISFQELVERMVKNDLELVKKEAEANN